MERTFIVACLVLACYMTTKETLRYFKNNDTSTITYENFATSQKDTYPTFSVCYGQPYSFFRNEIVSTFPIFKGAWIFARVLKGLKPLDDLPDHKSLDIRNISENQMKMFSVKLQWLYFGIKFKTEHLKDGLTLNSYDDIKPQFPFYVSYHDPGQICFTRKDDFKENVKRIEDTLILHKEHFQRFLRNAAVRIFIHYPGQVLRGFDAPVFARRFGDLNWEKSSINFKISHVSILRRRPDANAPCNMDLQDDDLQLRIQISEDVGCIPIYWTSIMFKSLKLKACNTSEEMKKIWTKLWDISQSQSTYLPPCNEMKMAVTSNERQYGDSNMLSLTFKYMDKNYQEIVNVREFEVESLWSGFGGFMGIFVGVSLSQVPSFITITLKWLRNNIN